MSTNTDSAEMSPMKKWTIGLLVAIGLPVIAANVVVAGYFAFLAGEYKSGKVWPVPPVVDPGPSDDAPPEDAIVLFDGSNLDAWQNTNGWKIDGDTLVVGRSNIQTKQGFGSCQLHIEWASPEKVAGSGQGRGNSGVFLMDRYEIQVLDSYENETYPDGQAGALYKQRPPMVNACRKPGEWQSFDIIFTAPKFNEDKSLAEPGYVTVFHNGVLIHNHTQIEGDTAWHKPPEWNYHPEKMPLRLQNHGNPVKFRNIWVREL